MKTKQQSLFVSDPGHGKAIIMSLTDLPNGVAKEWLLTRDLIERDASLDTLPMGVKERLLAHVKQVEGQCYFWVAVFFPQRDHPSLDAGLNSLIWEMTRQTIEDAEARPQVFHIVAFRCHSNGKEV